MPVHKNQTAVHYLWPKLARELEAVAEREPVLASQVSRLVKLQSTFEQSLALRLAQGLTFPDMSVEHVADLLIDSMRDWPDIAKGAAQDLMAILANDPASRTFAQAFLSYKGFHAVQVARVAHAFWCDGREDLAVWLSNRASCAFGADIHPAARLGVGIMLDHGSGIVIGETAVVEDGVTIMQNVTLGGTGTVSYTHLTLPTIYSV